MPQNIKFSEILLPNQKYGANIFVEDTKNNIKFKLPAINFDTPKAISAKTLKNVISLSLPAGQAEGGNVTGFSGQKTSQAPIYGASFQKYVSIVFNSANNSTNKALKYNYLWLTASNTIYPTSLAESNVINATGQNASIYLSTNGVLSSASIIRFGPDVKPVYPQNGTPLAATQWVPFIYTGSATATIAGTNSTVYGVSADYGTTNVTNMKKSTAPILQSGVNRKYENARAASAISGVANTFYYIQYGGSVTTTPINIKNIRLAFDLPNNDLTNELINSLYIQDYLMPIFRYSTDGNTFSNWKNFALTSSEEYYINCYEPNLIHSDFSPSTLNTTCSIAINVSSSMYNSSGSLAATPASFIFIDDKTYQNGIPSTIYFQVYGGPDEIYYRNLYIDIAFVACRYKKDFTTGSWTAITYLVSNNGVIKTSNIARISNFFQPLSFNMKITDPVELK